MGQDDANINEALNKLLALDLEELIEHIQWQELLSITLYYVSVSGTLVTDQVKIKCMKFLLRLAMGLPGHQAYEATLALLTYLYHDLSIVSCSSFVVPPSHLHRVEIYKKALERDLYYTQVSCVAALLFYNATGEDSEGIGMARHFLSLSEKEIDRLVSLVFIILTTRGYMSSIPSEDEQIFVPIMDLLGLSRFGPKAFNPTFISSWYRLSLQPSILSHSFATGFVNFLSGRLQQESYVLLRELDGGNKSLYKSTDDNSCWDYCVRIWSFYAVLWIGLITPHFDRKHILETLLMIPTEHQSEYPLEKLYSFTLNHQTPEHFGMVPKISVLNDFNKNYSQLDGKGHYLTQFMKMIGETVSPSSSSMDEEEHSSSIIKSTISLVTRVWCNLIENNFSELYCIMDAICAIYTSIPTKLSSCLVLKDTEILFSTTNGYLQTFLFFLERTAELSEEERQVEDSILEQHQTFFDIIVQTQGDLIADILSKSQLSSVSASSHIVQTRLDIFLSIVYAKKSPFHPVTNFTMGMVGDVMDAKAVVSLIDASFIFPARLCDYSMMLLELLNISSQKIENSQEICVHLRDLLKKCLDLIEMVISSSDGTNNYQQLQEYLALSPALRTLCGFICRLCTSECCMKMWDMNDHRLQDTDLLTIDMIVACHHVYNCRQNLKYSIHESQEAFITRISSSSNIWSKEPLSIYTNAFCQELELFQRNTSTSSNNSKGKDGTICTVIGTNIPTILYFMNTINSLVGDGSISNKSLLKKEFNMDFVVLGYSLFANVCPIFALQLNEIESQEQIADEKLENCLKLYEIRTIARFLSFFLKENKQFTQNYSEQVMHGNVVPWNCLRTMIGNTEFSENNDLCSIILDDLIQDTTNLNHDQRKQLKLSRLQTLLKSCESEGSRDHGQEGEEQLIGFANAREGVIKQLLDLVQI